MQEIYKYDSEVEPRQNVCYTHGFSRFLAILITEDKYFVGRMGSLFYLDGEINIL